MAYQERGGRSLLLSEFQELRRQLTDQRPVACIVNALKVPGGRIGQTPW
jgi:hypothetical protein